MRCLPFLRIFLYMLIRLIWKVLCNTGMTIGDNIRPSFCKSLPSVLEVFHLRRVAIFFPVLIPKWLRWRIRPAIQLTFLFCIGWTHFPLGAFVATSTASTSYELKYSIAHVTIFLYRRFSDRKFLFILLQPCSVYFPSVEKFCHKFYKIKLNTFFLSISILNITHPV